MNFKTTYILFGIFFVLLIFFGLTQRLGWKQPKETSSYALPTLNDSNKPIRAEDIESVEIERSSPKQEKLVFYRTEQGWQSRQPAVRLDNFQVERLIDQVKGARIDDKADVTGKLAQFGLDSPAVVVTLTQKGGEREWKLSLGRESPGGDQAVVYVTSSDRKAPMAVRRSDLDTIAKELNEFRSKDLLAVSPLNASYVSIQKTGEEPVILEKTSESHWRFQKPPYGEADYEGESPGAAADGPKNLTGVRELVDAIGSIRVGETGDFVAADVSAVDLAEKYGLDAGKPALLRIEVKRTPGGLLGSDEKKEPITEVLLIGKRVEEKDAKEEKYYARLEIEPAVVRVAAKNVDPIRRAAEQPETLRNRDLIQVDAQKTDALNIKNDTGLIKLRRPVLTEPWKLLEGTGPARNADDQAVQDLLAALNAKRQVKSFPAASKTDADLGLDKPSAEISVWVEGIQHEESKETKEGEKTDEKQEEKKDEQKPADAEPKLKSDKPTVKLVFGKRDGDVVYVLREEGENKTRMAVPATLMTRVNAGPLAYLDRTLPSFPADADVTRLVIVRNGEASELEKEVKDEKLPPIWKFKQPKDLAGRTANAQTVEDLVGDLRQLRADKLVAEKPSKGDLEKFGLLAPSLKVTVAIKGKDNKTEDHVYDFGKEDDKTNERYARQGARELVFSIRTPSIAALQQELLDPTVFRFDAAKVKDVKLTGWKNVYKSFEAALDLERKSADGKDWTVKAGPMGFELDSKKVEDFLASVSNLKADRFLPRKDAASPEHKLGKGERTLEIVVTFEGDKTPLTLTLGALDKDKQGYYAQSSTLPGDVFLVPLNRFQKVVDDGAGYFSKGAPAAE